MSIDEIFTGTFSGRKYVSITERALSLQELDDLQRRIPEISAQDMAIKYILACLINEQIRAAATILDNKNRLEAYDALPWWRKILWGFNGA